MTKRTAHVFEEKWRSDDVKLQEVTDFSALLVPAKILAGLNKAGYKNASPIQKEAIPVARFGNDLVVQAKSGTGKTLVFTIISLEIVNVDLNVPQILILAPTREIAFQICDVIKAVGSTTENLKCGAFIGGLPVEMDLLNIQGCQIVVGTPGRITQLMEQKILKACSIRLLILDEADQLLEPSFKSCMDTIIKSLPENKQIIATSATYPKSLANLVDIYFRTNPTFARLNENDLSLLGITHYTLPVENSRMPVLAYKRKLEALETILTSVKFSQCLVFCNQVSRVETLCSDIKKIGFSVTFISSAKDQAARLKAIDSLKSFKCKILVSSDITSRGIDAENVDLVINVDVPYCTEVYLHRVGRAGRYGSKGAAITLMCANDLSSFAKIQNEGNFIIYNLPEPVPEDLITSRPPKAKLVVAELGNSWKSNFSGNLNNFTVSQEDENGIDILSKREAENSNDDQNTNTEDSAVNKNISSEESAFNKNIGSEDSAVNRNVSFGDSAVNQNSSIETSAINISSEAASVTQSTNTEDTSIIQTTSSEDTSVYQSTASEDVSVRSVNRNTSSEDISVNQDTSSNTTSNQSTDFEETSSTNTALTVQSEINVNQTSVDKCSDKISGNHSDIPALNSKEAASIDKVDETCFLKVSKDKKSNNRTNISRKKKSPSTALLSSEQNCLGSDGEETGDSVSNMKNQNGNDEMISFVMNFINDYEKKNTSNLSSSLVNNADESISPSSLKTDPSNSSPLKRRNLIDYYYKVFHAYKTDFIATNGVEQLELIMTSNVDKKDVECAAVHIKKDKAPIADQMNLSLWAKNLGCSTYNESNSAEDSDVDSSAEDILVSTPNDKTSRDSNAQLVVSSDTPPFLNSFIDYEDNVDSSGSKYSSKCLQLETAHKSKIMTFKKEQVSKHLKNPKSKVQKVVSSDGESSESETSSSSDADAKNCHNIKMDGVTEKQASKIKFLENLKSDMPEVITSDTESSESETASSSDTDAGTALNIEKDLVNKNQVSKNFENPMSEAQNMESSGTMSPAFRRTVLFSAPSNSDTGCWSHIEDHTNKLSVLERAFNEMMKSIKKPQSPAEQGDQLKKILQEIKTKEKYLKQASKIKFLENLKSDMPEVITSDTESSESETASSSDTDAGTAHNIEKDLVNKNQVSKNFENPMSEAQNMESSGTMSPAFRRTVLFSAPSNSDTGCWSHIEDHTNKLSVLERAFNEMMKSIKKRQSLAEEGDQLKKILQEIKTKEKSGEGSDSDSLSDIHIITAGAHSSVKPSGSSLTEKPLSSRKTHQNECQSIPQSSLHCKSTNKSALKNKSGKISKNDVCSSADDIKLKSKPNKYQSDDQEDSTLKSKSGKASKNAVYSSANGIKLKNKPNKYKSHDQENSTLKSKSSNTSKSAVCSSANDIKLKSKPNKYQSDDQEDSISNSSESSFDNQKVSKRNIKTRQKAKVLPTRLNRFRDAEPYNSYSNHPHASRHIGDSHFNQQSHFQNASYPSTGPNMGSRPSQYSCHHSNSHHGNCSNAAFQNSRSRSSHCHSSMNHFGHHQAASRSNREHSRSTRHHHGMNAPPSVHPLSSDMYYRQWYWMQQGSFFQ